MNISTKTLKIENNPLVSVVVPVYNVEKYLSRCLESILNQSYKNIEIVVVDDGSTDHTGQIADDYQRKYPKKIVCLHLVNGGVLRARLEGIAATSGEWIGFVDGDDLIESDMYEHLINNAYIYAADISHCGYQTIINNGERIHFFYNTGRLTVQNRVEGVRDLLLGAFVEPSLCNKVFKRELFYSLKHETILNSTIKTNEDLLMNYLLFKQAKKSVFEDICFYHYIARNTSVTRSPFEAYKVLDPIRVRKYIFDDVNQENRNVACQKYLIGCMQAYIALYPNIEYKEQVLKIKQELLKYRGKWKVLRKAELIKLRLMLFSPRIYRFMYHFYEKFFQKKVYE